MHLQDASTVKTQTQALSGSHTPIHVFYFSMSVTGSRLSLYSRCMSNKNKHNEYKSIKIKTSQKFYRWKLRPDHIGCVISRNHRGTLKDRLMCGMCFKKRIETGQMAQQIEFGYLW